MSSRSQVESAILQFFEALNSDDASGLPLAEDIKYFGVLSSEPIRGETEVREHIQQVAPFMENETIKQLIIEGDSGAARTEFKGVNGVHVDGTYFLKVEDGKISEIRAVLDTRPLFAGRTD